MDLEKLQLYAVVSSALVDHEMLELEDNIARWHATGKKIADMQLVRQELRTLGAISESAFAAGLVAVGSAIKGIKQKAK